MSWGHTRLTSSLAPSPVLTQDSGWYCGCYRTGLRKDFHGYEHLGGIPSGCRCLLCWVSAPVLLLNLRARFQGAVLTEVSVQGKTQGLWLEWNISRG